MKKDGPVISLSNPEADIKRLHDSRVGEKTYCKNCVHAFERKIDLTHTAFVCHGSPPQVPAVPMFDNAGNIVDVRISSHFIPRVVPAEYWCGLFVIAPDRRDS